MTVGWCEEEEWKDSWVVCEEEEWNDSWVV